MIGRNSAVAEVARAGMNSQDRFIWRSGSGVHAILLVTTRAKVEAFYRVGMDYFQRLVCVADS